MSTLKFNFHKPKQPATKPASPVKTNKTAFEDEDEEEQELPKIQAKKKKQPEAIVSLNEDLRSYTSYAEETSRRMAEKALEEDPSVFDYDAVYDDLKVVERQKKEIQEKDRLERKPQYMDQLLASAELRKRDFLIAQERKYKKERETEGDEFAGKEKFVTSAYKKQQEELRKAEEAEREREEKLRSKSQGMASFYRNMLEEEEMIHEAAVKAASKAILDKEKKTPDEVVEVDTPREKKMAEEARAINAKLGTDAILINDEGEVVDKRQLLKGGLNVRPKENKETRQVSQSDYQKEYEARKASERDKIREREARKRQTRLVEEQYLETKKRSLDAEAQREEEIRLRAKSRKTSDDVMSARERYLARKKAATEGQ